MTNATRKWPRTHVCQQGRSTSEMPTSSQALILLNSELDTSLGLCSTRVRKSVTSTPGLMLSSLAIGVSQEQITITTATTSAHGCFNTTTQSSGDRGTMTISASTSLNANTKQNESQQRDCLQKNDVWIPRSSCSVNPNLNHSYTLTDSTKCRSLGRSNGGYHYRQPVILNSRHSHGPIPYDQCQQNSATPRDPSEEVWPVLDVRKSQQFYRPVQSLHVSTSTGEVLSPHSNPYEDVPPFEATPPVTQSTLNPINRGLIQRLRELGFRSRDNKEKNKNADKTNGKCEDEVEQHNEGLNKKLQFSVGNVWQRSEKNLFGEGTVIVPPQGEEKDNIKDVITAIPLLTTLLQQNAENNGHSQYGGKTVHLNKIDPSEETMMMSRLQLLRKNKEGNLENGESVDDTTEREKVDRLVANLQAALHQKKYKPPSVRMRKELPETRPLSVCFGCGSNVHISHEEVKRELESQYPGVSIVSLQFDPVSMNVGDPTTRNRWIVTLGKQDDCQMMLKGGVLLAGGDKVSVRPLDTVLKEEHSAYKLHQFVQEAKAKMSLKKDDHPRKSKRSKHKAKKKKLAAK